MEQWLKSMKRAEDFAYNQKHLILLQLTTLNVKKKKNKMIARIILEDVMDRADIKEMIGHLLRGQNNIFG